LKTGWPDEFVKKWSSLQPAGSDLEIYLTELRFLPKSKITNNKMLIQIVDMDVPVDITN
jgi:hypothetical protein